MLELNTRDKLESVFRLYEQVGVQRSVSAEQVDTYNQDTSALFHYIYAIYQRFPHPPTRNPLAEQRLRAQLNEYRERAHALLRWMQEQHARLQRRELPNQVELVRQLQSAHQLFIDHDVPPKLAEKQRLATMFAELNAHAQQLRVHLPHELSSDHIDVWWQRLQSAINEYSDVLAAELARLLRLQQLADQLQRDIRQVDAELTDVERVIVEEANRVRTLDPLTGDFRVSQIEQQLQRIGERIRSLYSVADQLTKGGYHAVAPLRAQIDVLHERWLALNARFDRDVLRVLEERRQAALRRPLTEAELIAKYESFRQLDDLLRWLAEEMEFWKRQTPQLPIAELHNRLAQLQSRHRLVVEKGSAVRQAEQRAEEHEGEERIIYDRMLNRLTTGYRQLIELAGIKLAEFECASELLQRLSNELEWLRAQQESLVQRDWSDDRLDVEAIEVRLQQLASEVDARRSDWRSLIEQTSVAINRHSPELAALIRPPVSRLQAAIGFLDCLQRCSGTQLSAWRENRVFFERAAELQSWLQQMEQKLRELLTVPVDSIEHGEILLKEMQVLRNEINGRQAEFNALVAAATNVVPMAARSRPPHGQLVKVKALCAMQLATVATASTAADTNGDLVLAGDLIAEPVTASSGGIASTSATASNTRPAATLTSIHGEQVCILLDNRGQRAGYWLIRRDSDLQQFLGAGVCFSLLPPDSDAVQLAQRLRDCFERLVQLWMQVNHRLRVQLIWATLRLVQAWDYDTYIAMPVEQRDAVLRALQTDIDRLAAEAPPNDPDVRQLRHELDALRRKFAEWDKRRQAELDAARLAERRREFIAQCQPLHDELSALLRLLRERCEQPIARDTVRWQQLLDQHCELDSTAQRLQPRYELCRKAIAALPTAELSGATMQSDQPDCGQLWSQTQKTWTALRELIATYSDRLTQEQLAIAGFDLCQKAVGDLEQRLNTPYAAGELTMDVQWRRVPVGLREMHSKMQYPQSASFDAWTGSTASAYERVRSVVVKSRAHAPSHTHSDLQQLRDQFETMSQRWATLGSVLKQLQTRLEAFQHREQRLLADLDSLRKHVALNKPLSGETVSLQKQLQELRAFYREHMQPIVGRLTELRRAEQECVETVAGSGFGSTNTPARLQSILAEVARRCDLCEQRWAELSRAFEDRERRLENALQLSEQFWSMAQKLQSRTKQLQDECDKLSKPALESTAIRLQLNRVAQLQSIVADELEPSLQSLNDVANRLCELCTEPSAVGVRKTVEDCRNALQKLRAALSRATDVLQAALRRAEQFDELLQQLLDLLEQVEERIGRLGTEPPSEADSIKAQLAEVHAIRALLDGNVANLEQLNQLAKQLMSGRTDVAAVRDPLHEVNQRWSDAMDALAQREKLLEQALLRLGKFEVALNELLNWLAQAENRLNEWPARFADLDVLQQQVAQHKQLQAELRARAATVRQLNEAGEQLDHGRLDGSIRQTLQSMNQRWQVLNNAADRKSEELARLQQLAAELNNRLQRRIGWIAERTQPLTDWPALAGLPDSARDQMQQFERLSQQLSAAEPEVNGLAEQLDAQLAAAEPSLVPKFTADLRTMRDRWTSLRRHAEQLSVRLRDALEQALQLQRLQREFVRTLDEIDQQFTAQGPISRLLSPLQDQAQQSAALNDRLTDERDRLQQLLQLAEKVRSVCNKSDATQIAASVAQLQAKYEKLSCALSERLRAIRVALQQVQEFTEAYEALGVWIEQARNQLRSPIDGDRTSSSDADSLKQALTKQKEFQRRLVGKQVDYENVMKMGKQLLAEAPKHEIPIIQAMLDDLRQRWAALFGESLQRQRQLEEALLVAGQLRETLRSLLDWIDIQLANISLERLYGDVDTVRKLQDAHRTLLDEMRVKQRVITSLRQRVATLSDRNQDVWLRSSMEDLDGRWARLEQLAAKKSAILADAEQEAKRLHGSVHLLLDWLSEAEVKLRFSGPPPEDEHSIARLQVTHAQFVAQMGSQERAKNECIAHAELLLTKCHPDAESTLQHWITVCQARWDELASWSKQWTERLHELRNGLANVSVLVDQLVGWLIGAETALLAADCKPPTHEPEVAQQLLAEHRLLIEELEEKRVDFERIVRMFSTHDSLSSRTKVSSLQQKSSNDSRRAAGTRFAIGSSNTLRRDHSANGRASPPSANRWKGSTPNLMLQDTIGDAEVRNDRVRELISKWQSVWQLAQKRLQTLQQRLEYLADARKVRDFDFDDWKRRFNGWIKSQHMRSTDFFRKIDADGLGGCY